MKALATCLIVLMATSCQRYLVVSTPEGLDVHVQGNHVVVLDSNDNYRDYYVKDAYKQFNQYDDVYRLLNVVGDPGVQPPEK